MRKEAALRMLDQERAAVLLAEAITGCCGDDSWRGFLCSFHDGYAQGLSDALDLLRAKADGT